MSSYVPRHLTMIIWCLWLLIAILSPPPLQQLFFTDAAIETTQAAFPFPLAVAASNSGPEYPLYPNPSLSSPAKYSTATTSTTTTTHDNSAFVKTTNGENARELLRAIRHELNGDLFYVRKPMKLFHSDHWFHIGEYYSSYYGSLSSRHHHYNKVVSPNKAGTQNSYDMHYEHPLYSTHKTRAYLKERGDGSEVEQNLYVVVETGNPKFIFTDHLNSMTLLLSAMGFSSDNAVFKKFGFIDLDKMIVYSMAVTEVAAEFNLGYSATSISATTCRLIRSYITQLNFRNNINSEGLMLFGPQGTSSSNPSSFASSSSSSFANLHSDNNNFISESIGSIPMDTKLWFHSINNSSIINAFKDVAKSDNAAAAADRSRSSSSSSSSSASGGMVESFRKSLSYYCPIMSPKDLFAFNKRKPYISISQCDSNKCRNYDHYDIIRPKDTQENGFPIKRIRATASSVSQGLSVKTNINSDINSNSNSNKNSDLPLPISSSAQIKATSKLLNLVIFQRDSTRKFQNFATLVNELRKALDPKVWNVFLIHHQEWNHPCAFVNTMRLADFFIAAHGFQNTGLMFMKPGSAILEIFPYLYYKASYIPVAAKFGVKHQLIRIEKPNSLSHQALKYVKESVCMNHTKCRSHARNDRIYIDANVMEKIINSLKKFEFDKWQT